MRHNLGVLIMVGILLTMLLFPLGLIVVEAFQHPVTYP